jgi:hypothetical protein
MDAPFTLEPGPAGTAILVVDDARLTLDQDALRELRDAIDAAVARGAAGGQGPVAEFAVGDAVVTVSARPGGTVGLRIDR